MKASSFLVGYVARPSVLVLMLLHLGWFFPCGLVVGATHFVANSNSTAARLAPGKGSEVAPWTNLSHALSRIRGGDQLLFKTGIYEAAVYLDSRFSGSSNAPTVIQALPGHSVRIVGPGFHTGRVKIIGVTNLVLEGLDISGFNQGIYVENSQLITIRNCVVHHVGQEAIHVMANSSHITIEGCTIHHTRQWRYNGEGIYIGTGSSGARDNTAYVTVRSNVIYQTTDEAIELKPGTHDCLIEGNLIHDVTTGRTWGAIEINEHALGQQFWGTNPNHVVCFNTLQDTDTAIRAGTGCVVSSNRIERVRSGNYGIYCDNIARDKYVRRIAHNLIRLPHASAIHVEAGTAEVQDNRVGQD